VAHLLLLQGSGTNLEGLNLNGEFISVAEEQPQGLSASSMIPGISPAISVLQRVIAEIAPTDIPVLILGESGTGKEIIAAEIHRLSLHRDGPFAKFNCSSMSSDSILGAIRGSVNGIATGQYGTVLLDEVSQLDLGKQSLLLNLLSDGERAVSTCLTSRIISTSTKDLTEEMRNGSFREELYFRLNGICLRLPSLRQRKDDIRPLFDAFLARYANLLGRQQPAIKNSTMNLLLEHRWPGNVRELENVARKFVVLGDDGLAVSDFALNVSLEAGPPVKGSSNGADTNGRSLKQASREASRKAERQLILESLERTHWNRKRSARELQISYKALLYKLKQLGLDRIDTSKCG
jgi:two-component system response regulator AtoC